MIPDLVMVLRSYRSKNHCAPLSATLTTNNYFSYFVPQRARIRSAIFASWPFCSLGV